MTTTPYQNTLAIVSTRTSALSFNNFFIFGFKAVYIRVILHLYLLISNLIFIQNPGTTTISDKRPWLILYNTILDTDLSQ